MTIVYCLQRPHHNCSRGQRQVLFQKRHAEATSSQIENELYEAKTKLGVLEEVCKTMNIDVQEKLAKALAEDRAKYEKEKENNYEELDQEISPVAMKNPVALRTTMEEPSRALSDDLARSTIDPTSGEDYM